jgi:hypothetical protein
VPRRPLLVRCLQSALAASLVLGLPAVARAEKLSGTLRIVHADDLRHGTSRDSYLLQTANGSVPLKVSGRDLEQLAGRRVVVSGRPNGDALQVSPGPAALDSVDAVSPTQGTGVHSVAVILFTGAWGGSVPSPAQADQVVFSGANSVNAFYREESWGKLSLRGAVFGPYVIPDGDAGCNFARFGDDALAQARAHGQNVDGYQHYLFVFPYTAQCQWAGVAELPGTRTWVNGELDLRVVGHELGHNFGLHHAASLSCADATGRAAQLTDSCSQDEYGDPFDNMGMGADGTRQLNAWHKEQAGWLGASAMQTVTAGGTYTVAPLEQSASGPIGLRIPRPGRADSLWVDFRQPLGSFDTYGPADPVVNGVLIHVDPDVTQIEQSRLIDATPETTTFADASLTAGRTFVDGGTGIRITTLSVSPLGAVVRVSLDGSGAGVSPPSVPTGLRAARTDSSVALTWLPSSDDIAVAGYQVFRDGVAQPIGSTSVPSFTDELAGDASHSYVVRAFDGDGNLSAPSAAASVSDGLRAVVLGSPSRLRAVLELKRRKLVASLTWTPSAGASSYEVLRGGERLGTVTRPGYIDTTFLAYSAVASARYTVRAVDADGHRSAPSAQLVLHRPRPPKLRLTGHRLRHAGAVRRLLATVRLVDVLRPARCRYRLNGGAWRACPPRAGDDVTIARTVHGRRGTVLLGVRVTAADRRSLTHTFRVR